MQQGHKKNKRYLDSQRNCKQRETLSPKKLPVLGPVRGTKEARKGGRVLGWGSTRIRTVPAASAAAVRPEGGGVRYLWILVVVLQYPREQSERNKKSYQPMNVSRSWNSGARG
jgi:hypothetical protein